jgi:hypothetical protein
VKDQPQPLLFDIGSAAEPAPVPEPTWPDWYTPCRETAATFNRRVLSGRHPFGLELGPADSTCGACSHLVRIRYAKTYLKCEVSKQTRGPGTDVRVKWRGCEKFRPSPPERRP